MTQAAFTEALLQARAMGEAGRERMQTLAEEHLPLVRMLARRMSFLGRSREELIQQGALGLMKALWRYDPAQGTAFSTYAAAVILGEMRQINREDAPIHVPRTEREKRNRIARARQELTWRLGREPTIDELSRTLHVEAAELVWEMEEIRVSSLDAPMEEDGAPLMESLPDTDPWLDRMMLRDLLGRLALKDRQLIALRHLQGLSQTETAARLSMTQSQVSRREKALRQLLRSAWLGNSAPPPSA